MLLLLRNEIFAQSDHDSTYYVSNKKLLSVGILQSKRSYKININSIASDESISNIAYQADARNGTGFVIDYDKFALSIFFRTGKTDAEKKGKTKYQNIFLGIGGNKWYFEGGYRGYKGFYDLNSPNYIPEFSESTPYYNDPTIKTQLIKGKGLYFLNNKKFAYKAAYSCGYRQLKSSWSVVFSSAIKHESISSDSALIPHYIRDYYPDEEGWKGISLNGFAVGAGLTGTVVFLKNFYINLSVIPYLETQFREYDYTELHTKDTYMGFTSDIRGSLGYNNKYFFILLTSFNDLGVANGKGLKIEPSFSSTILSIGYRFKVENTRIVKKMKSSEIYNRF